MPRTYEELLAETLPSRIESAAEYDRLQARFRELLVQRRRTQAEERLMALLVVLLQDYDRRHGTPLADSTAAERLQFLMKALRQSIRRSRSRGMDRHPPHRHR
jgi:hypothetical protein